MTLKYTQGTMDKFKKCSIIMPKFNTYHIYSVWEICNMKAVVKLNNHPAGWLASLTLIIIYSVFHVSKKWKGKYTCIKHTSWLKPCSDISKTLESDRGKAGKLTHTHTHTHACMHSYMCTHNQTHIRTHAHTQHTLFLEQVNGIK